ncbi:MAG: PDZ domain-containing protein [Planctomycetes bacterium]|nr:PDZ domain-containing protein [Planctomycetota bacterium]
MHRHRVVIVTLAALGLVSCASVDCSVKDEGREALQGVTVPASYTEGLATPQDGRKEAVHRQSYSIEPDGSFTFSRTVETEVGLLGADAHTVDEKEAKRLGVEPFSGACIRRAQEGSPAERAGLRRDDIVVSFGGKPVGGLERLQHLVAETRPGESAEVGIVRSGQAQTVKVQIGGTKRYVSAGGFQRKLLVLDEWDRLGLRVAELTDEVCPIVLGPGASEKGLLVLDVLPGGPAFFADLRVRDCILKAGESPVASAADLEKALSELAGGSTVPLAALRDGKAVEARVTVAEDAAASHGFNFLGVAEYGHKAPHRRFSLLWQILWRYEACHSVRVKDRTPRNVTARGWGAILNLFAYKTRSDGRKEIRLLWLLPIWWGGGE